MWLVLSDIHLGDDRSNINLPKLFSLLNHYSKLNCNLILNGDILDLARNLHFDIRHRIFFQILQKFKKVIYIEGNHDWFLSGLHCCFPKIEFTKELILDINNLKIKINHGHQADVLVYGFPILTRLCIKLNSWIYKIFKFDTQKYIRKTRLAKFLLEKQIKKILQNETSNVLISGHTHFPRCERIKNVLYCNTGDWLEEQNCCYIIIKDDGSIEFNNY